MLYGTKLQYNELIHMSHVYQLTLLLSSVQKLHISVFNLPHFVAPISNFNYIVNLPSSSTMETTVLSG